MKNKNLKEWKNGPVPDHWSDEKKEKYKKMMEANKALVRMGELLRQLMDDPNTEIRKQEYIRLKKEGKI